MTREPQSMAVVTVPTSKLIQIKGEIRELILSKEETLSEEFKEMLFKIHKDLH